jgi:hypothetical protein
MEIREAISSEGGVRVPLSEESTDKVDGEGERTCCGRGEGDFAGAVEEDDGGTAGDSPFPLPRIRPPPMVRRDMMQSLKAHEDH